MIPTFNIFTLPPTAVQIESQRKLYFSRQRIYVVGLAVSVVLLFMGIREQSFADFSQFWLSSGWWIFIFAGATVIFILKLFELGMRMLRLQETAWETLDAIQSSDIPQVSAYCKAVKSQGRVLTKEEAEGLLALCQNPDALEKIAASYDLHDEKHPRKLPPGSY
jgi:hypothetical protein